MSKYIRVKWDARRPFHIRTAPDSLACLCGWYGGRERDLVNRAKVRQIDVCKLCLAEEYKQAHGKIRLNMVDLTGLGAPMGKETTKVTFTREFSSLKEAKREAESMHKSCVDAHPDFYKDISTLIWTKESSRICTQDCHSHMFQILKERYPTAPSQPEKKDGRKRAYLIPQRVPTNFRNSHVELVISEFLKTGSSRHSGLARTLQYIIDFCEEQNLPYYVQAVPGKAYYISLMDPMTGKPIIGPNDKE